MERITNLYLTAVVYISLMKQTPNTISLESKDRFVLFVLKRPVHMYFSITFFKLHLASEKNEEIAVKNWLFYHTVHVLNVLIKRVWIALQNIS